MPQVFINGKLVNMPSSVDSSSILNASGRRNANTGTRAVIVEKQNGGGKRLKPGESFAIKGGEKFSTVPDRVKAATYFGEKQQWQKQLIAEQVANVSQKFFKNSSVELDDNCNWVVFDRFKLPDDWQQANPGKVFVRMMLIFPDQYPELPTNGFYLPSSLSVPANASHFYNRGYGGAFGEKDDEMQAMADNNWKWYCTHIKPGCWQPARLKQVSDWKYGDNLWDIIKLCIDVLTFPLDD